MCLVSLPEHWKNVGLTVMDGNFFSLTPFPAKDCHVLTHVTEGVHANWTNTVDISIRKDKIKSKFKTMYSKVKEFYPDLELIYIKSYYSIKTFIPKTLNDDRPIMVKKCNDNVTAIIGSKLDNIYDVLDYINDNSTLNKNVVEL